MKKRQIDEIKACLEQDREVFFYHKDRYANLLMKEILKYENDIRKIRTSMFAKLLNVKNIKRDIARCGDGKVCQDDISFDWTAVYLPFTITYSQWGSERYQYQTSRRGMSLVIQLNFSNLHTVEYMKLYKPRSHGIFNYYGHPVLKGEEACQRETLAWSRVDLDFSTNEALIEEIQTDWLRGARRELNRLEDLSRAEKLDVYALSSEADIRAAKVYLRKVLDCYGKLWAEAMLACTLKVLFEDIGIEKIFYHTYKSGGVIKKIHYRQPPKSLYTALPKKFCFKPVYTGPGFIENTRSFKKLRRTYPDISWQLLDIKGELYEKQQQKIAQAA